jgi:hypothetical protein
MSAAHRAMPQVSATAQLTGLRCYKINLLLCIGVMSGGCN